MAANTGQTGPDDIWLATLQEEGYEEAMIQWANHCASQEQEQAQALLLQHLCELPFHQRSQ